MTQTVALREWTAEHGTAPPPDEIAFNVDPADRFGKCRIRAMADGAEFHVDVLDPYSEYHRRLFCESICQKQGYTIGEGYKPDAMRVLAANLLTVAKSPVSTNHFAPLQFAKLVADYPRLQEQIIGGMLRRGETANIVSVSKIGKSWLAYILALCIVCGRRFLDVFPCTPGRVLLIDNELHPSTIAFRIATVANALGINPEQYQTSLEVWPLRGKRLDLHGVADGLSEVEPGTYLAILGDAWYRLQPAGMSENDNGEVMRLYNLIDSLTDRLQCCWVNIHHSSKGSQADKQITDVGAGAGSQSRAADAHIILRPHEDEKAVVLEAAVRSFPPIEPLALRWQFPLWAPDDSLDPAKLKGKLTVAQQRQSEQDNKGILKLAKAFEQGPATIRDLRGRTGLSKARCERLLDSLESQDSVKWTETTIRGNVCRLYESINLDNFNDRTEPFQATW